jgi:hypothetical protein
MQAARLVYISLFWIIALRVGPALAQQPPRGVVELDYIADRPQAGGEAGDGYGYEITAGYQLAGPVAAFGEYKHLLNPLRPRTLGLVEENAYKGGLELTQPVTAKLHWVSALIYEAEHDAAGTGASTERGYDLIQGLRLEATPRLELIADLHYATVGRATNAVVVGFAEAIAPRFAFQCLLEHIRSGGRYDNSYRFGVLFYC